MQSEKFDKRAKEAAEHHHPAYDEQAWDKMEKLLDKHLPQKEDRKRRFILFLFLFLMLAGGVWLFSAQPWKTSDTTLAEKQTGNKPGSNTPAPGTNQTVSGNSSTDKQPLNRQEGKESPNVNSNAEPGDKSIVDQAVKVNDSPTNNNSETGLRTQDQADSDRRVINPVAVKKNNTQPATTSTTKRKNNAGPAPANSNPGQLNTASTKKQKQETSVMPGKIDTDPEEADKVAGKENPSELVKQSHANTAAPERDKLTASEQQEKKQADPVKNELAKKDAQKEQAEKKDSAASALAKKPKKKPKKNSLFFSVSAGPDVSVVGSNALGKTKLVTGLGLSYVIKDRFSISTGFYSARKIYSAKPSDYKAPPEFYQAYPYLEKVDANCRVFEIPLTVSYQFGKSTNSKWFVSAGISSFLMNEEGYNYFYKYTPTGNTFTNYWKVKNENSHFFTVGTLSAGYKRNVGKKMFVAAEPYIKVPFSGVGYGKVKLNSGGVLFTVGMKVF